MSVPKTNRTPPSVQKDAALLISPLEQDHEVLGSLFREQDWILYSATSLGSASAILQHGLVPVVITERDLPAGGWKDVLEVIQLLPIPPVVIVTSLHADERLWAEALNLGAHDVVAKPFSTTELIRVLSSIWIRGQATSLPRSTAPERAFATAKAFTSG